MLSLANLLFGFEFYRVGRDVDGDFEDTMGN
jgi:hypothetical protein